MKNPWVPRLAVIALSCWSSLGFSLANPRNASPCHQEAPAQQPAVSALFEKGARQLSPEELRDLVFGMTLRVTDLRSGEKFDVFFGEDGTQTIVGMTSPLAQGRQLTSHPYSIGGGKLHSTLPNGSPFSIRILKWNDALYGVDDASEVVNYELIASVEGSITVKSLLAEGGRQLTTGELRELLVGRTITIRHLTTGELYVIHYAPNGVRTLMKADLDEEKELSNYRINEGRLEVTASDGPGFQGSIFLLNGKYYGARSNEEGFVGYEILEIRQDSP